MNCFRRIHNDFQGWSYNLTGSSNTPQIKQATRVQRSAALAKLNYIFRVVTEKQIPWREFKKL